MHVFIRKGDSLREAGGEVLEGRCLCEGQPIACKGDAVRCRLHGLMVIRGNVDEHRNSQKPEGVLRALVDDQVHGSRAWLLHALHHATLKEVSNGLG